MTYRYIALSEKHLATLQEQIKTILADWSNERLSRKPASITVTVVESSKTPHAQGETETSNSSLTLKHESLQCELESKDCRHLWQELTGQHFTGRLQPDQRYLLTGTLDYLIKALIAHRTDVKGLASMEASSKRGSGWCHCHAAMGEVRIRLLLPPSIVAGLAEINLATTTNSFSRKLASTEEAIKASKASVNARLGSVSISLHELKHLQVGDVLTVNTLLSDDLKLTSTTGIHLANARLGMQDGQKALIMTKRGNPI